jgi:hypothetical protein
MGAVVGIQVMSYGIKLLHLHYQVTQTILISHRSFHNRLIRLVTGPFKRIIESAEYHVFDIVVAFPT